MTHTLIEMPPDNFGFYAGFGDFVNGHFRSATCDARLMIYKHRALIHSGMPHDEYHSALTGYMGKVDEGKAEIGPFKIQVRKLPGVYFHADGGSLLLVHEIVSHEHTYHHRIGAAISVYKEEFMTEDKYDALAQFIREERESYSLITEYDKLLEDKLLAEACKRLDAQKEASPA